MEEEKKQQEAQNEVISGNRNASYFADGEGAGGQIGPRRPGQGLSQNPSQPPSSVPQHSGIVPGIMLRRSQQNPN